MENIPQPSDSAYEVGDRVRIYLSDEDMDAAYHGVVCEVVSVLHDDLDEVTGRELDSCQYSLKRLDDNEEIRIAFRHEDLVPEAEWPVRE